MGTVQECLELEETLAELITMDEAFEKALDSALIRSYHLKSTGAKYLSRARQVRKELEELLKLASYEARSETTAHLNRDWYASNDDSSKVEE